MDHHSHFTTGSDAFDLADGSQSRYSQYQSFNPWPPLFDQGMDPDASNPTQQSEDASNQLPQQRRAGSIQTTSALGITTTAPSISPLQTTTFGYSQSIDPSTTFLTTADLTYGLMNEQAAFSHAQTTINPMSTFAAFHGLPIHTSPTDEYLQPLPTTTAQEQQIYNSLASSYNTGLVSAPLDALHDMQFQITNVQDVLSAQGFVPQSHPMPVPASQFSSHGSSPNEGWLDARSISNASDTSWTMVPRLPNSWETQGYGVVSPSALHVRTDSNSSHNSDCPPFSARSVGSYDEIIFPVSPEPDASGSRTLAAPSCDVSHIHTPMITSPLPAAPIIAGPSIAPKPSRGSSTSSSPMSSSPPSTASSPKTKRRSSPVGITQKVIQKKKATSSTTAGSKDQPAKKVGRRKGPLRPEQRQQAHEIRKLRACLRCKFLKKVCDKGDPCGGCQPSHARLWQVPCTRIDIKDIGYFLKEYDVDYKRHVTLEFSVANIKSFSPVESMLYVTHGYGFCLPLWVREVYVHKSDCFNVDWVENTADNSQMQEFDTTTAHLSAGAEGVSQTSVSQYLDAHVDQGFEKFIDDYFEGTPFISQLLKTIYRFYQQTKMPVLKKGLKLVVAYCLTQHITLVTGQSEEDSEIGKIDDPTSRYHGQTCAPVMINFQVKRAMADTWRELMKEILEELSALYSSVYSGDKLKNWPTIFLLAALILAIWELMQFDVNFRTNDETYINKFCAEMENVPVGVIVGLFCAISTKLPSFLEWDTRKHSHVLQNNMAVCNVMTEVRKNVEKHGKHK